MPKKLTQEEVVTRFKRVHGDKYDYSKVEYKGIFKPIIAICKKHGEFDITPNQHLKGCGCPYCAGKRHTAEWAIQRAKEVHGDKFTYLPFQFVNNKSEMNILCPIHGLFHRTVQQHVNEKNGCPKCCKTTKMNNDSFLAKARAVHGDAYEYLDTYINSKTPIRIRCKKHGHVFNQAPGAHLRGNGCYFCGRETTESAKRLTLNEFIEKSNEVHNNKYDYTAAEYINGRTKTTIICPIHGPFEQTPEMHMAGQGCPKCAGTYNPTTEEFKQWFISKFGNEFDLSEVEYTNNKTPIIVTCAKGHRIERPPYYFANSEFGCPICGYKALAESIKLTQEEFIRRAIEIHGDKYIYDKAKYNGMSTPVTIICKIHGDFSQRPSTHLNGCGCKKCGRDRIREAQKDTIDDFIYKARQAHGLKYDYSESEYKNSVTPIKIICPTHGPFWQTPITHSSGHGCPGCNESKGERSIRLWLENHNVRYVGQYRVELPLALFSRNHLKIDFYLPDYNTFIEFHGKQHYTYMPFFHRTEEDFLEQQDRDRRLREYCCERHIRLIEIVYDEIDNIANILVKNIGEK